VIANEAGVEHTVWSPPAVAVGFLLTVIATLEIAFEQIATFGEMAVRVRLTEPFEISATPGV
jgi:hypothetical protein